MHRVLLSRRWLGLTALVLVLAPLFLRLALWQLHRLDARRAANALVAANYDAAPVPAERLLAVGRDVDPAVTWRPVTAVGAYDTGRTVLVRNRTLDGKVGAQVLVPFVTSSGTALLVDRGFVQRTASAAQLLVPPPPPAGQVTIVARLRPSEPASATDAREATDVPQRSVVRIDVPRIAATLPYPVYGGYGRLAQEDPPPATALAAAPKPELGEGPHLAYAVQWVLFALLAVGGWVVLLHRDLVEERRAAGQPAPAPPVGHEPARRG